MKKFLSVILAAVLVFAVASAMVSGTLAGFYDVESSTNNEMCSGNLCFRLIGEPLHVEDAWPCEWYTSDMEVVNCGSRDGIVYLKLENIEGIEDVPGPEVTSEPERVAEYGGAAGEDVNGDKVIVPGLGEDTCDVCNHIDLVIWYDKDGDGVFERAADCADELIWEGKLGQVPPCTSWKLGELPAAQQINGGWGTYFAYHTGDGTEADPVLAPFIANQHDEVGWVSIWNDGVNLYVDYDTRDTTCWKICETHVHAGIDPPTEHGWGRFPYGADHPYIVIKEQCHVRYRIPLGELGATPDCTWLNIAAHAQGGRGCEDTGWAMRTPPRKLRVQLHMQDAPEACFSHDFFDETIPAEAKWDHWPTNAYQGDICRFDMKLTMDQDCWCRHWEWRSGTGWTYNWYHR